MQLAPLAATLLERGVVIKFYYTEGSKQKFITICSVKHADKFGVKQCDGDAVDVILDSPVDINKYNLEMLEYQLLPPSVYLEDLTKDIGLSKIYGHDFLIQDHSYVDRIKTFIQQQRAQYISYLLEILEPCQAEDKNLLQSSYVIRFHTYPPANYSRESIINDIKKDAIEKYFIARYNKEYILPGLKQIGATNDILTTDNKEVLDAVKYLWYHEIDKQKQNALIYIDQTLKDLVTNNTDLTEDERQEYLSQGNEYKKAIVDIDKKIFNECTTVRSVLNIWPDILFPLPWFAYGN